MRAVIFAFPVLRQQTVYSIGLVAYPGRDCTGYLFVLLHEHRGLWQRLFSLLSILFIQSLVDLGKEFVQHFPIFRLESHVDHFS